MTERKEFVLLTVIRKYVWTILGCVLSGVAAHLYVLTNTLQNYDNIYVNPVGYGTGVDSGRWFLSVLGNIVEVLDGNYNLSYLDGLSTILVLTITVVFIVDLFQLADSFGFLFGAVFLSFPTITATLFFMYTAPYYALAILMAIVAVWCAEKTRLGFAVAIVLEACSMGIYQAYIPMTATLFVLLLISKSLDQNCEIRSLIKRAFYYLFVLIGGFIAYFCFLNFFLTISHKVLTDYANIDQMGRITLSDIPVVLKNCYSAFYTLPFKDYWGITSTSILKLCVLILGVTVIGMLVYLWRSRHLKISSAILCVLLCGGIYPVAVNGIEVICFNSRIYVLMIYSTVFLFLLPLLLLQQIRAVRAEESRFTAAREKFLKGCHALIVVAVSMVAVSYIYLANVNYTAMFYANQQTTNYLNRLIMRVQATEGYNVSYQWAVIGDQIRDASFVDPWNIPLKYGANVGNIVNAYSRNHYISKYLGFTYEPVEASKLEELRRSSAVQEMPCYPDAGSIRVIGDVVVIKFGN